MQSSRRWGESGPRKFKREKAISVDVYNRAAVISTAFSSFPFFRAILFLFLFVVLYSKKKDAKGIPGLCKVLC